MRKLTRELPFPRMSFFSPETVAKIKAIPDDQLVYTEEELLWAERAVENLNFMISDAEFFGTDTKSLVTKKKQLLAILGNRASKV